MRKLTFSSGEYYHLYNRGVDKRVIFTSKKEYMRFMRYLTLLNDGEITRNTYHLKNDEAKPRQKGQPQVPLVAIGAFCLMPNHFHLLVTPLVDTGVSRFMHKLQTAYTMYFNGRHERNGALFQGTFKARHANRDAYLKYLFSYIHLNPAKLVDPAWRDFGPKDFKRVRNYIQEYPFSSFQEYIHHSPLITNQKEFPKYFLGASDFQSQVDWWLSFKRENDEEESKLTRLSLARGV